MRSVARKKRTHRSEFRYGSLSEVRLSDKVDAKDVMPDTRRESLRSVFGARGKVGWQSGAIEKAD